MITKIRMEFTVDTQQHQGGWAWLMSTDPIRHRIDKRRAGQTAKRNLFRIGHYQALYGAEIARLKRQYGGQIPCDAPELWDRTSAFCTLGEKAAEESRCQNIPGVRDSVYGDTLWDSSRMVSTRAGRQQMSRALGVIDEIYRNAPAKARRSRSQQAALDAMFAPDPLPHDPRPWSAWGQL